MGHFQVKVIPHHPRRGAREYTPCPSQPRPPHRGHASRLPSDTQRSTSGITPSTFAKWAPVLAVWGVGAGAAVVLLASDIPRFKRDVLDKVPVVREYFVDKTPDSDKPFSMAYSVRLGSLVTIQNS